MPEKASSCSTGGRTVKLDIFLIRFGLDFFRFFYVFGFEAAQKRLLDGLGVETLASGSPSGWNQACLTLPRFVQKDKELLKAQWFPSALKPMGNLLNREGTPLLPERIEALIVKCTEEIRLK